MSAVAQLQLILDRVAEGSQLSRANWTGGSYDFWSLVDNASDETFENRVKGSDITAIDTDLSTGTKWTTTTLKKLFTLLEAYFRTDLGYSTSGTAPAMAQYLAAVGGFRVPYEAAERLSEALGSLRLPASRVFPEGTRPEDESDPAASGMHLLGTLTGPSTWEEGSSLASTVGPAGILAINQGSSQSVGATMRCYNYVDDATYVDLALSLSGVAQYTQTILGQEDVTGALSPDDTDILVAATAAFTAGEYALLYESDTLQELVLIGSIDEDTSVTASSGLLNTYTTAAVLIPLFSTVEYQSGGTGTGDVEFYALPDRTISL